MTKERLQKLLAQANIASRRASEDLITRGRVRVNGEIAKLGDKADPQVDTITVDGVALKFDAHPHLYIALNKPKQVLSTDKPHRGDKRQTVSDLIGRDEHLFSVGRLDADSEGLVVMTNDGELAQRLTHPRYRHTKTYRVEVYGLPTAETIERWQSGIVLEDGMTAPCHVEIIKGSPTGSTLRIVMTEGKKRQIRRVANALGHPVQRLTRTHIGMLALGSLAPGQWRELTPKEVLALKTPAPESKLLRSKASIRRAAEDRRAAPLKVEDDIRLTGKPTAEKRFTRKPASERDQASDRPRRKSRVTTDTPSDRSSGTPRRKISPRGKTSGKPTSRPNNRKRTTRRKDTKR